MRNCSGKSSGSWLGSGVFCSVTPTSLPSVNFDLHRLSFGAAAAHYDKSRPTYPASAIRWALNEESLRVVDLGAGTGLLTRATLSLGHVVIPVEPDPGMRAQLEKVTGIEALDGSAESIPLPDESVDAVIAGQAYHWFNGELAHPEIARVLKPGGAFAALWNDRDPDVDWVARFGEILNPWNANYDRISDFGALFTEVEERAFKHATAQTPQGLEDLVASRSYYLVAEPETQQALLAQVRELCEKDPALQGKDNFDLPYVTYVHRAFKR
jgi:SAM-dependent methyltransferase